MKGRDLPRYVTRRKRDGKLIFQKRYGGKAPVQIVLETQFPEGAPVPFALHQEVERILNAPTPVPQGRTLGNVIRRYQASADYRRLARRTVTDYEKRLDFLRAKIGHLEPRQIQRRHVIDWRDAWARKSPHEANYRLRVLRIVLERAIDYGLLPTGGNPAKGVAEVRYDRKTRSPWPPELVDAALAVADARTALLIEVLLGTGQRIGDVLAMRWSDYDGQAISVCQSKTKAKLWIPASRRLKAALDAAPRRSVFIFTNAQSSGPWSYRAAAQAMRKVRAEVGALGHDLHAFRYTAAAELAALGLDDDTIMAVTGHQSRAMVAHYAGPARQRARAAQAVAARDKD